METFLNRYRNITVLLLVIFAQLVLLAVQVKNDQDVRLIRVWAVSTVTPVARVLEGFREGGFGFVRNYILMHDASEENRRLRDEVGRLRLQVNYLQNELSTADRAKALQLFQAHTQSKMLAANVIGTAPGANSKVVYINRSSRDGVMRGMGVVTPDGIVGKVIAAYPTASEVMLITDPEFAAGVISQKSQVRGTLKGQGTPLCKVDYVPFDEKVEPGDWFYTSGDDRVFPRGFPAGVVKSVENNRSQAYKEILVEPSGLQHGLEDVLIILEAVHQPIPQAPPVNQPVYLAPAPPQTAPADVAADGSAPPAGQSTAPSGTAADKIRAIYQQVGEAQGHNYGSGPPGTKPPDFTKLPTAPGQQAPASAPAAAAAPGAGNGAAGQTGTGQTGGRAPAGAAPAGQMPSRMARQAGGAPGSESSAPAARTPAPVRPPAATDSRAPAGAAEAAPVRTPVVNTVPRSGVTATGAGQASGGAGSAAPAMRTPAARPPAATETRAPGGGVSPSGRSPAPPAPADGPAAPATRPPSGIRAPATDSGGPGRGAASAPARTAPINASPRPGQPSGPDGSSAPAARTPSTARPPAATESGPPSGGTTAAGRTPQANAPPRASAPKTRQPSPEDGSAGRSPSGNDAAAPAPSKNKPPAVPTKQ